MASLLSWYVEHRTGIAEVTGSDPVEALIFSGFLFPIAQIGKLTAMIILQLFALFEIGLTSTVLFGTIRYSRPFAIRVFQKPVFA